MIFFNLFKVTESPTPTLPSSIHHRLPCLPRLTDAQHLLAGVTAVFTLEPLLIFVSLLMLNQGVAFMEDSRAAAAFHLCSFVSMHVEQMNA